MSLTSFIKIKEVRIKFRETFIIPEFILEKPIAAEPLTNNYMLVGTAFDYLLRFYLKRLNPNAITSTWVAELAVKQMSEATEWTSTYVKARAIVQRARRLYNDYLRNGEMTKDIMKSVLLLAQLDRVFREGRLGANFGIIDKQDAADLENLIKIVNSNDFTARNICLLNPTFGKASELVGGADADLLIDDTLIDIKTTKYLRFDRAMLNQLLGYYVLYKIGGIGSTDHKINRLGIYYSRHGELHTFSVHDVIGENDIAAFIRWFENKAAIYF